MKPKYSQHQNRLRRIPRRIAEINLDIINEKAVALTNRREPNNGERFAQRNRLTSRQMALAET